MAKCNHAVFRIGEHFYLAADGFADKRAAKAWALRMGWSDTDYQVLKFCGEPFRVKVEKTEKRTLVPVPAEEPQEDAS